MFNFADKDNDGRIRENITNCKDVYLLISTKFLTKMELKNTCFVMFPKLLWISIHDKSSKTSNGDKSSNEDLHVNPTADEESHDHEQWRHRINLRSHQLCWQCQLGQTSRSFVGILNNPHQMEWISWYRNRA